MVNPLGEFTAIQQRIQKKKKNEAAPKVTE